MTCSYVVDPDVLGRARGPADGDRHAAEHLIDTAPATVRDVARMRSAAEREDRRLLTFTLETEVRFAAPADVHRFTEALAGALADVVARFDAPDGRPYRLIGARYPAPRSRT